MKFFAIYTTVNLTEKPVWFDKFREKYDLEFDEGKGTFDVPYDLHITLTQPRFIQDDDACKLIYKVKDFFENNKTGKISIDFSKFKLDRQDENKNGCIMIEADNKVGISRLQKKLSNLFVDSSDFCEPLYEAYEINFAPHITIARDLSKNRFDCAESELPEKVLVKASVSEVILAIVPNKSSEERKNPKNLTVFRLQ